LGGGVEEKGGEIGKKGRGAQRKPKRKKRSDSWEGLTFYLGGRGVLGMGDVGEKSLP